MSGDGFRLGSHDVEIVGWVTIVASALATAIPGLLEPDSRILMLGLSGIAAVANFVTFHLLPARLQRPSALGLMAYALLGVSVVAVSGGVISWFFPLLLFPVFVAGIHFGPRAPLGASMGLTVALLVIFAYEVYSGEHLAPIMGLLAQRLLMLWATAFFAAGVGGTLARQRQELEERAQNLLAHRQALQKEGDQLRAILEAVEEGILVTDLSDRYAVVNRRLANMFGWPNYEALIGRPASEVRQETLHLYADPQAFHEANAEVARNPHVVQRLTFHMADGRVYQRYTAPVRDAKGEMFGRLWVYRDVTREAEIDRMKAEFIATVSHELRTPLTAIKGAVRLMLGGIAGELPEKARDLLSMADQNADRLIRLIGDILDMSRIEAGKLKLELKAQDIRPLIFTALEGLQPMAANKGVRLVGPPEGGQALVAPVDGDRIIQVLTNLVGNAIKFTPGGGLVRVQVEQNKDEIQVHVTDTGPGIPPDQMDQLFQKFAYVTGPDGRRTGAGAGLGLAISAGIVSQHGGRIWARSTLGKGSTFSFALPRKGPAE